MIIKSDPDIIKSFLEDNSGLRGGYVKEVSFPESTEEVSLILSKANKERVPVTVAGNGTGVAGGRVPFGGLVLSTERLNKNIEIKRLDDKNGKAKVHAGAMLKDLKEAAKKEGLLYPPDPTEDTAYIGGNVATNASGARGFKYGPTRRYISGLKVVLADGTILDIKRGESFAKERLLNLKEKTSIKLPSYTMPSVKNAAGYYIHDNLDAVDLFIGQEGTLGIISEIELDLIHESGDILSFFAFFDSDKNARNFASALKRNLKEALSVEYFDINSLALLKDKFPYIPDAEAALFFEKEKSKDDIDATLEEISGSLKKNGAFYDQTLFAQNENEYKKLFDLRHGLPERVNEIVKANGFPKVGTDIAVPEEGLDSMLSLYKTTLERSGIPYVIFGHIAECHLHVNTLPSSEKEYNHAKEIYIKFVEAAVKLGGTVSAEHGIGKLKHKYLEKMYGPKAIREMASLKKAFDPNCILGVGNIFPKELLNKAGD
ncbi:MAG: FAD-binding oxidoreductase [Candidatus Omnitrophica bacterium]|nr:FAD-binding oxidoreductase [Candidatus Omnitrophota bacterium]